MGTSSEVVAYNLCREDYYDVFDVFLECSLCNAGWPMRRGRVTVDFYTVPCRLNTGTETYMNEKAGYPSPSWFWGFETTEIMMACPPVAEGQERDANLWVGRATRGSAGSGDGATILLEILAKLRQLSTTSIQLDLQFNVLKNGYWQPYFNVSTNLSRKGTDTCMPCGRSYSSDYLAVAPAADVCPGDLRFVRLGAGTSPWFEGCGGAATADTPAPCGFYNGSRLLSCFRALTYSKTNPPAFFPTFTQIGYNRSDCQSDYPLSPMCKCLTGIKGPGPGATPSDTWIVQEGYFDMGCPGETPTAVQSVQIGTVPGYEIVAKNTGDGNICLGIRTDTGQPWELASSISVVNGNSPYILKAEFTNITVYLYAMQFPNPDLLPEFCYSGTGTTPNCGNETFVCNGTCVYTYSALFESWVLTLGSCTSGLGYACSCVPPPDPSTISPPPADGDTYETNCRG